MCSVAKLRKEAVVEKLVGGDNLHIYLVPELNNTIKVKGLKVLVLHTGVLRL